MQKIEIGKLDKLPYSLEEAYNSLRTNLWFCGKDVRVIAVTSCMPNDGKTSVCFNLARSIAESGKSVLLIDADMRKSVMAGRYRIGNAINGLSHLLSGQTEPEDTICETNVENLHLILAGPVPPNPSKLLSSDTFRKFVEQVKEQYDYVIIDTPPLGSVIDAAVISKTCDGICMVISANEVSYRLAQKVKEQLEKGDCRILGVILNKVRFKTRGYYNRYYSKYYGKYYGSYYGSYYGKQEEQVKEDED